MVVHQLWWVGSFKPVAVLVGAAVDDIASAASASTSVGDWIQRGCVHVGTPAYTRSSMNFTVIKIEFSKTW
jgi:hypothetical protein